MVLLLMLDATKSSTFRASLKVKLRLLNGELEYAAEQPGAWRSVEREWHGLRARHEWNGMENIKLPSDVID